MDSQPLKPPSSTTRVTLESGYVLLKDGRAERMLDDIVTESMNPGSQRDQSTAWQIALVSLANVMPYLKEPRSRWGLKEAIKRRFPAAIAAYEHPLVCRDKRGTVRFALLRILSTLAEMASTDRALYEALDRHGIPYIAVLTWLSGYDAAIDATIEQSAEATTCCSTVLKIIEDHGKFVQAATVKMGTQTVAMHLLASFRPHMEHKHFGETCLLACSILDVSGPEMAHEFLRNKVPVRILPFFWELLACEPTQETNVLSMALGPVVSLVMNTMMYHFGLGDSASTAYLIEMVQTCDLASLCTLASYRSATNNRTRELLEYDEAQLQEASKGIIRACASRPDLMPTHVSPPILSALDHLRDLGAQATSHLDEIIKVWLSLTEASSLKNSQEKAVGEPEALFGMGTGGCSWHQCIFHGGAAEGAVKWSMLLDNFCKRVQYCSRYCQKRDWKDGGHRGRCALAEGV